jgi:hypothetical protein
MSEVYDFFFGNNTFLEAMYAKFNIENLDVSSQEIIDVSKREDLATLLKNYGWNNFTVTILSILLSRKNTILYLSAGGKVKGFEVADIIDPSESFGYKIDEKTPRSEREELSKKMPNELLPARFDAMGSGDIPPDSFMVKHRLRRLPYNKTQKYKDSVKIPQTYSTSSLETDTDVV